MFKTQKKKVICLLCVKERKRFKIKVRNGEEN